MFSLKKPKSEKKKSLEDEKETNHCAKKLIILGLNGILLARPNSEEYIPSKINPLAKSFLNALSDSNIDYAFWTIAGEECVEKEWALILASDEIPLKKEPVFVWSKLDCEIDGMSVESIGKPLYLKPLKLVWRKYPKLYNKTNTLLVDHSQEKIPLKSAKNSIIVYQYHAHSIHLYNPVSLLLSLLDSISKCKDIRSLDSLNKYKPSFATFYFNSKPLSQGFLLKSTEKKIIKRRLDFSNHYRSPASEMMPLLLATYSSHVIFSKVSVDILRYNIYPWLSTTKQSCNICLNPTSVCLRNPYIQQQKEEKEEKEEKETMMENEKTTKSALLNCGCAYYPCFICRSKTHQILLIYHRQLFMFDNCPCHICESPFQITILEKPSFVRMYAHSLHNNSTRVKLGSVKCECTFYCEVCDELIRERMIVFVSGSFGSMKWCGCPIKETQGLYL